MRIRLGSLWIIGFVIAILGSWVNIAHAGDVKLSWTSPLTCADNSALANCPTTGYEISQGANDGPFAVKETVAGTLLTRTFAGLTPGKYCYFVKTASGTQLSAESNRVCADVPSVPPKAPQGLTITVSVTVTPGP